MVESFIFSLKMLRTLNMLEIYSFRTKKQTTQILHRQNVLQECLNSAHVNKNDKNMSRKARHKRVLQRPQKTESNSHQTDQAKMP